MTKKKNSFLRALAIYCVVLAVIFAAALIVLRQFLVSYEASRPDNTVIAFMAEKDLQFWLDGADSVIKSGFNEFSDLSAGIEDFGIDPHAELNWRSAVGGNDSVQYYDVRLGTSRFCRITLTPGEDVGFGFKKWEVTNLEFSPGSDTTITVHVPSGATATINGIAISSDYLKGNGTLGVTLNHSFDQAPISDVYVVDGMRGPIDLKAYSADGTELTPNAISNSEFEFLIEPSYSMQFVTRADAKVSVNGMDITGTYCENHDGDVFEEPVLSYYECSGLYTQPDIFVTVNGEALSSTELSLGTFYGPGASAEVPEKISDFVTDFIEAYIAYSSNQGRDIEGNFAVLSQYLIPESDYYNTMMRSKYEAITWVREREITFRGMDIYDCIPLSDGSYLCSVEYRLSIQYTNTLYEPDTVCVLHIVPYEGGYRVAVMTNKI